MADFTLIVSVVCAFSSLLSIVLAFLTASASTAARIARWQRRLLIAAAVVYGVVIARSQIAVGPRVDLHDDNVAVLGQGMNNLALHWSLMLLLGSLVALVILRVRASYLKPSP